MLTKIIIKTKNIKIKADSKYELNKTKIKTKIVLCVM